MDDTSDIDHVRPLEPEVELLDDRLREELDESWRVGEGGDGDSTDEMGGESRHDLEIGAHQARHIGTLDLDDHLGAVEETRRVDLGDGGRGQRLA